VIRALLAKRRFTRDHRWTQAHLSDYVDDDLHDAERDRLEHHVHRCPQCRRMLETLRRTLKELSELRVAPGAGIAPGVIDRLRRETR
jgi:anti-sigma factor RsiW